MVDKSFILKKLSDIEQYNKQLAEYKNISVSRYADDWKAQRIVERTLQIMIETCLDISGHIISDEKFRPPENYADTFKVLLENGIINDKLYDSLEKMAKFRNYIVHQYTKIDPVIVVSILKKNLKDINEFNKKVIDYINSQKLRH